MFFNILANTSMQFGALSEGYLYAGKNLKTFLSGQSFSQIKLPPYTSFGYDYGILRATKIKLPQGSSLDGSPTDGPAEIRPLLYVFLQDFIQPALISCTTYLLSDDFKVNSRETWSGPYSPRPYDTGWWGAFGHVEIDATYSNTFVIPIGSLYYISTKVDYRINDQYAWFYGKSTPFGYPLASSTIWIPHEWEISLVNNDNSYGNRANMFRFNVDWSESLGISLTRDFSEFSLSGSTIRNVPLK